jgi:ribosomal protein L29
VDLDRIRPGMNPEELERVRQEIARVASQTLRGL